MEYIEELREKRRSSLIVVLTLGLAAIIMESVRPLWMTNLFEGLSFAKGPMAGFFKLLSYFFLAMLLAAIFFIIHLIKVIYYTIEILRRS